MSRSIFIASKAGQELTGLSKGFANYGYEVVINDGKDVMHALHKCGVPSVIILDSLLHEEVTTLEVCRQVRQNKHYARTPILIIKDKDFHGDAYLALGVKEFIERPVSLARIHEAIGRTIPPGKLSFFDGMSDKKKVMGVVFVLLLFLAFMTYWVFIPMIVGNPPK